MIVNIGNGLGQIGVGIVGPVDQGKCVITHFAQFQRMGKAVVHGPYIHEAAARVHHGELCPRLTPEEKQPGVPLRGVGGHFLLGIDGEKDLLSLLRAGNYVVDDLHRLVRLDIAVPHIDAAGADLGQRHVIRHVPINGEQQAAEVLQRGICDDLAHGSILCHNRFPLGLCGVSPNRLIRLGLICVVPTAAQRNHQGKRGQKR